MTIAFGVHWGNPENLEGDLAKFSRNDSGQIAGDAESASMFGVRDGRIVDDCVNVVMCFSPVTDCSAAGDGGWVATANKKGGGTSEALEADVNCAGPLESAGSVSHAEDTSADNVAQPGEPGLGSGACTCDAGGGATGSIACVEPPVVAVALPGRSSSASRSAGLALLVVAFAHPESADVVAGCYDSLLDIV